MPPPDRTVAALKYPEGRVAGAVLAGCGSNGVSALLSACKSSKSTERINASSGLESVTDARLVTTLRALFKDGLPEVRYHAAMAAPTNWDPSFVAPLIALFRDPKVPVRWKAADALSARDAKSRIPEYISMLGDPDSIVQAGALRVLLGMNRDSIPTRCLLALLYNPQPPVILQAISVLEGNMTRYLVQQNGEAPILSTREQELSSVDVASLTTNRVTAVRLLGLKIQQHTADAGAVELALPLLRDPKSLVQGRAFALLQALTGQDIPQGEPDRWEQWWAANKATFKPRGTADQPTGGR